MYALAYKIEPEEQHKPFLEDLVGGGRAALTREVGDFILTSTKGSRVEMLNLLEDDTAWGVLSTAETWSVASRLQWLFTVGVDPKELPTHFFCELYRIT